MSDSKQMTAVAQVCRTIKTAEFREQLRQALPKGVDPDRFERAVLTAIQVNPSIADCDRTTLYTAAVRAASDGLLPDGREGAFVEFKKKDGERWIKAVQWMPMVRGVIKQLAKAGIRISTQLVYANDTFAQKFGDEPALHHEAPRLGVARGEIVGAYAIAHLPDGSLEREVMDRAEIEQVRASSRSKDSGPWVTFWGEMARKTVLRRLAKRLPILDPDVDDLLAKQEAGEVIDYETGEVVSAAPAPDQPRRIRALEAVKEQAATEPEPDHVPAVAVGDDF